jgi:hypothetical protein
MSTPGPEPGAGAYVTEIGYAAADSGPLQVLHSHMPEPEPLPGPELEAELEAEL